MDSFLRWSIASSDLEQHKPGQAPGSREPGGGGRSYRSGSNEPDLLSPGGENHHQSLRYTSSYFTERHKRSVKICAPSMGDDWWVKVPYGGWLHQPLAKGKGVTVKWGLEEAGGKPAI